MIVIGTAGHIDHGKSSIVKCLTGTDPDRLPEEKKRGMTIDLGFAFYQTSKKETFAFVDVPGHERFVKNMISGASGIDAVMLVVAADDGWMPQTEEHFQIVRLLGVRSGFIVLNKCDLSDKKRLTPLRTEIKERVHDSFLSKAPIFELSSTNGDGYDALKKYLDTFSDTLTARRDIGKARLCIDRVFVQPGIGAIATGTLKDGIFSVGQSVSVWPSLKKGKIRTLQSNSQDVDTASPSQRTAVSLTGITRDELVRGGAILANHDLDYFKDNPVLALRVELLKESNVILESRRRALLLVGTSEMEGEVRLYQKDVIKPGESEIAFFKPDEALLSFVGDHFILRLPTPMVTLGGGVVLDHLKSLPKKKVFDALGYLENRNVNDIIDVIKSELQKLIAVKRNELLIYSDWSNEQIEQSLGHLIQDGTCGAINGFVYETKTMVSTSIEVLNKIETALHSKSGLRGLSLDEITGLTEREQKVLRIVLIHLVKSDQLVNANDLYKLSGAESVLPLPIKKAHDEITKKLNSNPYTPPTIESLVSRGKAYKEAVGFMLKTDQVHKCGSEFLFISSAWSEIESFIRSTLQKQKGLKVGELRDKFNISRKYAVPILEETDRIKLTRRQGDVRVQGEKFEG